jgi:hypothetical protein
MNERIKELAEAAYREVACNSLDGFISRELVDQRFAELILADIDKIIDVVYMSYPLQQAVVCLDIDFMIKENFYGTQDEDQITK